MSIIISDRHFYEAIQRALAEPVTEKKLQKAEEIFDRATEINVWRRKSIADAPLSCSYKTYMNSMTDYREESRKIIQIAKNTLYPPTCTLNFGEGGNLRASPATT